MTGYRFDCAFCDIAIENDAAETIQEDARNHIRNHRSKLEDVFPVAFGGTNCQNDCGYEYPVGVGEVSGYECPECGYDNFEPFIQQYVYWRIEAE